MKKCHDHKITGTGNTRKVGRPSRYRPEFAEEARKLCLLKGATNKDLAEHFGVCEDTIIEWKKKFPEFSESIKEGKRGADMEVANAMYRMATGYREKVEKPVATETGVEIVEYEQYFPPSVPAAFIWLKNRQSGFWKDKHEIAVSTGLTGPEREELDRLYKAVEEKSRENNAMLVERRARLKLIRGDRADGEEVQNP